MSMETLLYQKAIKYTKRGLNNPSIANVPNAKKALKDLTSAHPFYIVQDNAYCYEVLQKEIKKLDKKSAMHKFYRSMPFDNMFIECRFNEQSNQPGRFAIHVREDGPKKYDLVYIHEKNIVNTISIYITLEEDSYTVKLQVGNITDANVEQLVDIATVLLGYIESKEVVHGEEKISQFKRNKLGSSCPKPLTYITRKRKDRNYNSLVSRRVEWFHSWRVSGHWRKCEAIGKDRYGVYGVQGFTWVKDHVRGEGALIEKQRIVK